MSQEKVEKCEKQLTNMLEDALKVVVELGQEIDPKDIENKANMSAIEQAFQSLNEEFLAQTEQGEQQASGSGDKADPQPSADNVGAKATKQVLDIFKSIFGDTAIQVVQWPAPPTVSASSESGDSECIDGECGDTDEEDTPYDDDDKYSESVVDEEDEDEEEEDDQEPLVSIKDMERVQNKVDWLTSNMVQCNSVVHAIANALTALDRKNKELNHELNFLRRVLRDRDAKHSAQLKGLEEKIAALQKPRAKRPPTTLQQQQQQPRLSNNNISDLCHVLALCPELGPVIQLAFNDQ